MESVILNESVCFVAGSLQALMARLNRVLPGLVRAPEGGAFLTGDAEEMKSAGGHEQVATAV
jgi:hypothetical protein